MKKILLIDSSPRIGANSEVIVDTLALDLKDADVTVFKMREKNCSACKACGACQGKDEPACIQQDDISPLLPLIDECDAIVFATPIYNHQINSQAKLFIERFYPFFNITKENMTNTKKRNKKAALICSCWGGPRDIYEKYAQWTADGFAQIGVRYTKSMVFNQLTYPGAVKEREDYMEKVHNLAKWLGE